MKQKRTWSKGMNVTFPLLLIVFFLTGCEKKDAILLTRAAESESPAAEEDVTDTGSGALEEIINGNTEEETDKGTAVEPAACFVHICGAVINPGVYELPPESRVFEAVMAAGGFTEDACTDYINQAGKISDGIQIIIPTLFEAENEGTMPFIFTDSHSGAVSTDGNDNGISEDKININTASKELLCTLPGIGDAKAAAMISYRENNRYFSSIEEVMEVEGIKDGLFAKIKDKITV